MLLRGLDKEYYSLIMEVSAKIAAFDKSGKLGREEFLASSFGRPMARHDSPEAWGVNANAATGAPPSICMSKLRTAIQFFSNTAKILFPSFAAEPDFISKFTTTMMTLSAYSQEIEFWKHSNPDYVALGHANLNIDNAYFWHDGSGKMDCGVLDWGGFGAGCLGHKVWWYLNCCEFEQLKQNLLHYIAVFVNTYESSGGPRLDLSVMEMMVKLTCLGNLMFMASAVPDCLRQCPQKEWQTISGREDPRVFDDIMDKSTLRTTLRVMDNGLRMISELEADKVLQRWIDDVWVGQFKQPRKTDAMIFGT